MIMETSTFVALFFQKRTGAVFKQQTTTYYLSIN